MLLREWGCLLKLNKCSLHPQRRFFRSESLPEMNSHSFLGMSVVKSLVYNGRFSVGGLIRPSFPRSKRDLVLNKKESTVNTESKSASQSPTEELSWQVPAESCVSPTLVSSWHDGFITVAGDFQCKRSFIQAVSAWVSRWQFRKIIAEPVFIVGVLDLEDCQQALMHFCLLYQGMG